MRRGRCDRWPLLWKPYGMIASLFRYPFVPNWGLAGIHASRSCRSSCDCLQGSVFPTGEFLVGKSENLCPSGMAKTPPKLSKRGGEPTSGARDGVTEERPPSVRHSGEYRSWESLRRKSSSGPALGHGPGESGLHCP